MSKVKEVIPSCEICGRRVAKIPHQIKNNTFGDAQPPIKGHVTCLNNVMRLVIEPNQKSFLRHRERKEQERKSLERLTPLSALIS